MLNKFWNNFFRKDLNLQDRWWHRFLLVVFCIFALLVLIARLPKPVPRWGKVDTFANRMTSQIQSFDALVKPDERIHLINQKVSSRSGEPPSGWAEFLSADTYFSNDLPNRYQEFMRIKNIESLYIVDQSGSGRRKVSSEVFETYIKRKSIKGFAKSFTANSRGHKAYFLQVPTWEPYQNFDIYKKSRSKTILGYIPVLALNVGIFFLVCCGVVVVYYQIVLYVIFGSKKV